MENKTQIAFGSEINQAQGDASSFAQGKKAEASTSNQISKKQIRQISGIWGFIGGIIASILANIIYSALFN